MYIKEVQNKLRQIKNANISQGDIAKALGTTRSNVSQLFSKNSLLTREKLTKIEKYFNVNLNSNDYETPEGLVKIPLYSDTSLSKTDKYIYISDFCESKPSLPIAIKVNSNSMMPYINKGDFAIFDKNYNGFEDGRIFLIRYEGNFFIKRILNNVNEIILKSDNKDYTDISISNFKLDKIEVIAKFHSLLRCDR